MTCKAFTQTERCLPLTNRIDNVNLYLHAYDRQQSWRTETWIYEVFSVHSDMFMECYSCDCMLVDKGM